MNNFLGHVPDIILEKIPGMLGIDGLCATPSLEGFEEGDYETPGDYKRKRRQSVGGKWSWQSHLWGCSSLFFPEMCLNIKKHKLWCMPFWSL